MLPQKFFFHKSFFVNAGQLVLWDVINKKELKKVKDAHLTSIIYVKFYRRNSQRILSCDTKGVILLWTFSKMFFSYQADRSCIADGRIMGSLYDITLYKPNDNYRHLLDCYCICAVANADQVFFITIDPSTTIIEHFVTFIKREHCSPILAFRLSYSIPRMICTYSCTCVSVSLFLCLTF